MTKTRLALILAAAAAIAIQFVGPGPTNPPASATRALPSNPVFDRACRDCHSNQTRWPWYSHVAPARWLVVDHVAEGREHLNASDFNEESPMEADHVLVNICKLAKGRKMPLWSYLLLHRDATLTDEDIQALCAWSERLRGDVSVQPAGGDPGSGAAGTGAGPGGRQEEREHEE